MLHLPDKPHLSPAYTRALLPLLPLLSLRCAQPGGTELEEGVIPAEIFVPQKKSKYPEPVIIEDGIFIVTIECRGKAAGFTLGAAKDSDGNAAAGVFVTTIKTKSPAFHCGALAGSQVVAVAGVDVRKANLKAVTNRIKACGDTIELTLQVKTDTIGVDGEGGAAASSQKINQKKTKRRQKGTAAAGAGNADGNARQRVCATPNCGGKLMVGNWYHDGGEAVSVCRSCYMQAVPSEQGRFFEVKDTGVFDELFGASVAAAAMGIVPPTAAAAEARIQTAPQPQVLNLDANEDGSSDIDLDELDFGGDSHGGGRSPPTALIRPRTSSVLSMDELDFGGGGSTTGTPPPPDTRASPATLMIMLDEADDVGSSPTPIGSQTSGDNAGGTLDVPVPVSYLTSRRPSMDLPRAKVLSAASRVKSPGKRPPSRRHKAPPAALNLAAAVPVGGDLREAEGKGAEGVGERPLSPSLNDRDARAQANLAKLKAKRNSKKSKSKSKSASKSPPKLQIGAPTDFVHLNVGGIQEAAASVSAGESIAARMASFKTASSSANLSTPKAVKSPGGASLQSRMSSLKVDSRFNSPASSSSKCEICGKKAYLAERLEADGKVYHKKCFKCTQCGKTQSVGSYAALQGKIYCKPHFKQLFKSKGNYDEGFGTTQAKHKWDHNGIDAHTPNVTPTKPSSAPPSQTVHFVDPESASKASKKQIDGIAQTMSLSERTKRLNESHNGGTPDGSPRAGPSVIKTPGSASLQSRMSSLRVQPASSVGGGASGSSKDTCSLCGKKAYLAERLEADGKVYHKKCFKCTQCGKTQSVGSYAALQGKIYCKPHFKQLFKSKGNYDEGFGTTQAKHKWDHTTGGSIPASKSLPAGRQTPTRTAPPAMAPLDAGNDSDDSEEIEC